MDKEVAIIGYAQTQYEEDSDASRELLVLQVARAALDYAGLRRDDIDTVIQANNDYLDGRTISNMRLVEPSGASHQGRVQGGDGWSLCRALRASCAYSPASMTWP